MPQTLKTSLRGCYEIALFLKQGVERFENSKAAFLQSLLIPLLMIPLQIPLAPADPELSQYPLMTLVVALSYRCIFATAFFLGTVWLLTWPLERKDLFFRFATAANWLNVTAYVILLLYFLPVLSGVVPQQALGNFLLFLIVFVMALMSFTARHALNTNWGVGIGIGILVLIADIIAMAMLGGIGIQSEAVSVMPPAESAP